MFPYSAPLLSVSLCSRQCYALWLTRSVSFPAKLMFSLQQFKNAESKIQELTDTIKTMKAELDRKTTQLADANAEIMKLQSEVQHCKAEFLDAQRAERATRVDLEQAIKKVEM